MYSFILLVYAFLVRIAGLFGNKKARDLSEGQINSLKVLQNIPPHDNRVWFHCASVGEFEQARPLIEELKSKFTDINVILTFYSPSGYNLRKNYQFADHILYLPLDTAKNAKTFIEKVQPKKIFFVKYEFWRNFLKQAQKANIPTYLVSGIFRPQQAFFKFYGGWFRSILKSFTHFFVQNQQSLDLLKSINIENATIVGDTRFDRVFQIAQSAKKFPLIESFIDGKPTFIAGSTWQPDEKIIFKYILENHTKPIKYIITPHELHPAHIQTLAQTPNVRCVLYSQLEKCQQIADYQVLIIDNIGMLSSIYRYARVAYIGGGFGKGIHNTLEAAVYNIPVIFGPNHKKFQEALDLLKAGAGFSIENYQQFAEITTNLFESDIKFETASKAAKEIISKNLGATEKIIRATQK